MLREMDVETHLFHDEFHSKMELDPFLTAFRHNKLYKSFYRRFSGRREIKMEKKILVCYFSASGVTARTAKTLAKAAKADLFEIKPQVPYTRADLDWTNKQSRSTVEMKAPASRPAIAGTCVDIAQYDLIFVGFPIWWYVAPTIVNTFLESCALSGKKIVLFATSGGSSFGKTLENLQGSAPGATLVEGAVLHAGDEEGIARFAAQYTA